MNVTANLKGTDSRWKKLYTAGGWAGLTMLVIMALQIILFILWPPPASAEDFFELFQKNTLLGLLSLDLLYLVNNALLILIYLALYMSLKRTDESLALIALVFGLVGTTLYFASNTAFEMLQISRLFAAADSEAQRTALLGAGQAVLAIYKGTAFNSYYILNAVSLLVFASVMLRSKSYPRLAALIGLASGVLMFIPSTAGTIGLIFSLASLVPWAIFLVIVSKKFLQFANE